MRWSTRVRRWQALLGVFLAWGGVVGGVLAAQPPEDRVVVVHWANSHMTRPTLLGDMAGAFNARQVRTAGGWPIEVRVERYGSAEQMEDLAARLTNGIPVRRELSNPTIVTPSADHWVVDLNRAVGRTVVDLTRTRSIARTWIGIVTYKEMAECLGWPQREIGYADILALRADPRGWAAYPCARAEWGQRPLMAYTDPTTSSTGRSVLFSLYAIAAGKPPDRLTSGDVSSPAAVAYVKRFQQLVDRYDIGTIPLNTKVYQGPRYGHFFLMPEDNLIHLYQGTEFTLVDGKVTQAPPIKRPMVMVYPKEGSAVHNHSASLVRAPWVTPEHEEAARLWVEFLHDDEQQRTLMKAGFRPATGMRPDDPISGRYGLDPAKPTAILNPDRIDPAAAAAIEAAWEDVKKPGILTFVVDTSASMSGRKLDTAKAGLSEALDKMAQNNEVGLITFSTAVNQRVPVAPLRENRFRIQETVRSLRAGGNTALYEAIRAGIELTDRAPGPPDAIRGVVVMTDGLANVCGTVLHDLIEMMTTGEQPLGRLAACSKDQDARAVGGVALPKGEVIGVRLRAATANPVQVFFIGIGSEVDRDVGRLLAEATGAVYQGASEKDLQQVIVEFSKYF